MLLKVYWSEVRSHDLIPMKWFEQAGRISGQIHEVTHSDQSLAEAKCNVEVEGLTADLDYRPFRDFNDRRKMEIGVTHITFQSSERNDVSGVQWKDKYNKIESAKQWKLVDELEISSRSGDKIAMRAILERRGQPKSRNILLKPYEGKCAISRCSVKDLLEAAHVKPYAKRGEYEITNGIILRSDLHTLFDLGLLKIDPDSMRVVIDKKINDKTYRAFHGIKIHEPEGHPLEREFLRARWNTGATPRPAP
jgi:HNH endonuclease